MKNTTVKKLQSWTKRDLALNIFVYLFNFIVLAAMFVGMVLFSGTTSGELIDVLVQSQAFFLLVLLAMVIFLMIIYLAFEQRDFLKNCFGGDCS